MILWIGLRLQSRAGFYVCTWPGAELAVNDISGRLPPFDGLSERQLWIERISKLNDRSA
jgi:hypothetical protein